MARTLLFSLLIGLGGIAVLLWLGFWQLDRLAWKEGILSEIDARIAADPVPLPDAPDPEADNYLSVRFTGAVRGGEIHVLTSGTAAGTGYRVISAFETTEGRRLLLDQGLLPLEQKAAPPSDDQNDVLGTLLWPDDVNSSTPEPDLAKNIWFARDVAAMAEALETEPVLVVARTMSAPDPRLTPLPVDTGTIKNDHLEYAITWFLLAAVWAGMTGYLIYRSRRPKDA